MKIEKSPSGIRALTPEETKMVVGGSKDMSHSPHSLDMVIHPAEIEMARAFNREFGTNIPIMRERLPKVVPAISTTSGATCDDSGAIQSALSGLLGAKGSPIQIAGQGLLSITFHQMGCPNPNQQDEDKDKQQP